MALFNRVLESNNENSTDYFDKIIGHIEDIVINAEFQQLQHDFMERNYQHFDNSEENKIIYTNIFNEYTVSIENFIIGELNKKIDNFDMEQFIAILECRKSNLDGEIFDLLFSVTDFLKFKEMILDYKLFKEGNYCDLGDGLVVTSLSNKSIVRDGDDDDDSFER